MPDPTVEYLYPVGLLDGDWSEKSGNRRVTVRLAGTIESEGIGETDVIKVHLSDLKTPKGQVPGKTAVEKIKWHVNGLTAILEWDRAPHAEIFRIDANGEISDSEIDWTKVGGKIDPGGDDRSGDILLTTTNTYDGNHYDITMEIRLKD